MATLVYINGQFLKEDEATVSALDLSVLRGYGVMDYLRTYGGDLFRLSDHVERFFDSAQAIDLEVPVSQEEIVWAAQELVQRGGSEEMGIKMVLTGGLSSDQLMPDGSPVFFMVAYPFKPFPPSYYKEGIVVALEKHQRDFPEAKTIHYLPAIVALKRAAKMGAGDVLFYNDAGWLRETGTANFFAVKEGKIITPGKEILRGITRKVVMELCEVEEREIHVDEIASLEGAFLTSSNKEIMPVKAIGNVLIGGGVIPLIIRDLMKTFESHVKNLLHNI